MKACHFCGRVGSKQFEPWPDTSPYTKQVRCKNREACQHRLDDTTASSKCRQIRALLDYPVYRTGSAGHLVARIREILDAGP